MGKIRKIDTPRGDAFNVEKCARKVLSVAEKSNTPKKRKKSLVPPLKLIKQSVIKEDTCNNEEKDTEAAPDEVGCFVKYPGNPNLNINKAQIKAGVHALLALIKKPNSTKKILFDDEATIFLQISCIKVPKCPTRLLRLPLKHSLLTDSSEICIIVPDLNRRTRKDHEPTVEFYENLLHSKGIKNIKTIIPLHQLKTEYDQYELKRRLVELYDLFLVDAKICGIVAHQLGKIFYQKRKMPTPVKLRVPKLKEHMDSALLKTSLLMHSNGDSHIVQIGHTKMDVEKILENVLNVCDALCTSYPGGWDNVRGLHLKTSLSNSVPIYLTLKKNKEVNVPVIRSKRPKAFDVVQGELTTRLYTDVSVLPTGVVHVQRSKRLPLNLVETASPELSSDEDFEENEAPVEHGDYVSVKETVDKTRKLNFIEEKTEESDDENMLAKEEEAYLNNLMDEDKEKNKYETELKSEETNVNTIKKNKKKKSSKAVDVDILHKKDSCNQNIQNEAENQNKTKNSSKKRKSLLQDHMTETKIYKKEIKKENKSCKKLKEIRNDAEVSRSMPEIKKTHKMKKVKKG